MRASTNLKTGQQPDKNKHLLSSTSRPAIVFVGANAPTTGKQQARHAAVFRNAFCH